MACFQDSLSIFFRAGDLLPGLAYLMVESQNTTLQLVAGSFTTQSSFLNPCGYLIIIGKKFIYQVIIFFVVCGHSPNKSNDLHVLRHFTLTRTVIASARGPWGTFHPSENCPRGHSAL